MPNPEKEEWGQMRLRILPLLLDVDEVDGEHGGENSERKPKQTQHQAIATIGLRFCTKVLQINIYGKILLWRQIKFKIT